MTEVAERYLGKLGERYMVQLRAPKTPGFRRITSCRLHDLMRDLCLLQAEEESFVKSIKYSLDSLTTSSSSKFRRLVINLDANDVYVPPKKEMTKCLRMLRFVGRGLFSGHEKKIIKSQLSKCEMLRVLSIEGFKLPEAMGKLIHLRYLSLKGSASFALPSSLCNLKHLQTLDIRLYELGRLPSNILRKMVGLKTLYLPKSIERQWCKVRLDGLSKLEILENFDDRYFDTNDLPKLTNLRVLHVQSCWEFENLETIANFAWSSKMLQQVSISTRSDFTSNKDEGLTILRQLLFGRNIHSLSTAAIFWKLPECESSNISSRLVQLSMNISGLEEGDAVGTLEKLPQLRILVLESFRGKEMIFHATGFPQLKVLTLSDFRHLEKLAVEEGSMSNLRSLLIYGFPVLETIPDGLRFISTLEVVSIVKASKKLGERIRTPDGGEGEDFDKIRHVHSVTIAGEHDFIVSDLIMSHFRDVLPLHFSTLRVRDVLPLHFSTLRVRHLDSNLSVRFYLLF